MVVNTPEEAKYWAIKSLLDDNGFHAPEIVNGKIIFKDTIQKILVEQKGFNDEIEKRWIEEHLEFEDAKIESKDDLEKLKLKFLELVSGRIKLLSEASELLVKYILSEYSIYTTRDDVKSEMWIYKNGIYVPQGRSEVKEIVRTILEEQFNTFYYNLVLNKIEADTYIDQEKFFSYSNIDEIPVMNGILNLKTRELDLFSPEKIFFNKLQVEYHPDAKCPQIDKFLSETLKNQDDKDVFYELGGFCLWKEYKFEKAFMFVGNGRNGKDKSLELIKRLIGVDNCCSVPLASIVPDSFIISEFHNKMANLAGEINNQDLKDTSSFKALTGRSLQSAPRKFLRPISFVNYAKFIFACNDLPMVYDNSKGFWDRWIVLEFPYTFVTQQELDAAEDKNMLKLRDESIIERITTPEEMSGLLNRFLDGLDRVMQNKGFSSTTGSTEVKNFWIRKSNSVMAFCLANIEEEYDSCITKKDFRKKYSNYCKKHKVSAKSDFVIKRTVEELYGTSEGNKSTENGWEKTWEGIKWLN